MNQSKGKLSEILRQREISLLIVLIILCAIVQFRNSSFLTVSVINSILKNYAYTMVLSFGMMIVLLIGGIDISVGATLAFCGMAGSLLMKNGILPNCLSVYLFTTVLGFALGALIGLVIAKGKVIPIIATLGFQYIYRGMTYLISGSTWVGTAYMLQDFKDFAQGSFLGINHLVCITIVIFVVFFVFLKWTMFGRQIYAVGSNAEAAEISGIKIDRIKILVYAICGAIAGLCGSMYTGYYASAQNDMATGTEMDVIAACVIGGVSLNGGQGSAVGVLLGAIMMAVIGKSLTLIGIDAFWQQALKGAIILLAVVINVLVQRGIDRRNLEGRVI
ncbi:MAG: ABC transporter permease [Lachnospiraceae bacterium]|nr:ABC transporter permease [Lachnospiraceae bacterium]